jgi:phosphonate transport system substrate-binding protein
MIRFEPHKNINCNLIAIIFVAVSIVFIQDLLKFLWFSTGKFFKKICISSVVVLLLAPNSYTWAACLGDHSRSTQMSVAIVPQLPGSATYAKWAPILEYVGKKTGQCFNLEVPETIPGFEKQLFQGEPDFAFANPYHLVIAKKRKGYVPLFIDGQSKLTGILVIKADSSIKNIQDLQGKEIAFPAPNAFAASLLIRADLEKKGVLIKPRYVKTHATGYRAVAMGDVVGAGGVNNTLQREDQALKESLKILYETPGYAPHPFIANPRVPIKVRNSITEAFISLGTSESGRKLLEDVQIPQPIPSDFQRDFAPLEKLKIEKFLVLDAG